MILDGLILADDSGRLYCLILSVILYFCRGQPSALFNGFNNGGMDSLDSSKFPLQKMNYEHDVVNSSMLPLQSSIQMVNEEIRNEKKSL